jgi:arylsulfatase A
MTRTLSFITATLACLYVSALLGADRPPNVVIIFADDLGYGDLGCFGATDWTTPHLDRLAEEGMRFTDFYAAQAVCSASRAALLTGCYPNRIGILGALGPGAKHGLHEDETTIAEMLKARGYATAIFGKWHLGHYPQFLPTRHGFDAYFGLPYSNDMFPFHPTDKSYPDLPLFENERIIGLHPDQTQLTTWYTQRAVKFIDEHHGEPFFVYVPHSMPHVPLHVSAKYRGSSPQGLYGDVIQEIDWSVGQIMETLDRLDLAGNTLVIFTSDNGPWLSYGNHAGSAGGLREGKGTTFDGGQREPTVFRWKGHIPAGSTCAEPTMTIDVLPTLAHLAGADLPPLPIDGIDISPLLEGKPLSGEPRPLYFYWDRHLQAIRQGKWKLHFPHEYRTLKGEPGRDGTPGPYRQAEIGLALFDLEADPGERHDVAADHPDVVALLQTLADQARADLGDSAADMIGAGVREPGRVNPRLE